MNQIGNANTQAHEANSFLERISTWWDGFTSSRLRVFGLALFFALFFCGVTELTWVKADLNDDYTIASVLSGRLMGDDQGMCLFLNVLLCNFIYFLNSVYPHFNWFAVLELVTVFVSYLVICYVAIRYLRIHMALLTVALVAFYTLPGSFTINNFTYVAFICSCAGCVLLARSLCDDRHNAIGVIGGIFLLSLGSLWRNIMAWLCVPIFGIAAIAIVVYKHADGAALGKSIARLWPFILAVVIGFGLTVYDLAVWKASPWDTWRTFNDERSMLSDFPHYKYDVIEDELKALGVSRNDYEVLFSWTTEDPEFFTTERITAITDVAIIDWADDKTPFSVIKKYAKNVLGDVELLILAIAVFIVGVICSKGRSRAWAIAIIAMALIMSLFFSAMGRLPERVHYPIWLYTICAIGIVQYCHARSVAYERVPITGKHVGEGPLGAPMKAAAAVGCVALALAPAYAGVALTMKCVDHFAPQRIAVTFDADNMDIGGVFTEYIHEHPNNVFVLNNAGHRQLRMEHYLKAYYDDETQFSVVSLGGWLSRSPYNEAKNASLGMSNPIKGLVDNDKALLVVNSAKQANLIETYLREHYYPNAHGEVVEELGKKKGYKAKLFVYRFTDGE